MFCQRVTPRARSSCCSAGRRSQCLRYGPEHLLLLRRQLLPRIARTARSGRIVARNRGGGVTTSHATEPRASRRLTFPPLHPPTSVFAGQRQSIRKIRDRLRRRCPGLHRPPAVPRGGGRILPRRHQPMGPLHGAATTARRRARRPPGRRPAPRSTTHGDATRRSGRRSQRTIARLVQPRQGAGIETVDARIEHRPRVALEFGFALPVCRARSYPYLVQRFRAMHAARGNNVS